MKKKMHKFMYIIVFIFTINSCQFKEEKAISHSYVDIGYSFIGKWLSIKKTDTSYYRCTKDDSFLKIDKDKISDHRLIEDSQFRIDHIKNIKNKTYVYLDKSESEYYIFHWVDESKGIASWQLNSYEANIYIKESNVNNIENRICTEKQKFCNLKDLSKKYNFKIEPTEYLNEKEQKNPVAAWIIIESKIKKIKPQEIHFEPNSWTTFSDLPCKDFIVKDFNFDGLEDFAFVWDNGGSSGKLFEYYFQDGKGNFIFDDLFPLQHKVLATEFDIKQKTIITTTPSGCCSLNINKYHLNPNGIWETITEQKKLNEN